MESRDDERMIEAGDELGAATPAEDADTARLVERFQGGDRDAFTALYSRYFDRVHAYLRLVLKDVHEAEDSTQQVFLKLLESLAAGYEQRRQPFRAWLFVVVRNHARDQLAQRDRVEVMDPAELNERREREMAPLEEEQETRALGWVTDPDMVILVRCLPPQQRQVLAMRFLLGFRSSEIAAALDLTPNHVSVLQYRALGFLRERLIALGREPKDRKTEARMLRVPKKAVVLRARRYSLGGG